MYLTSRWINFVASWLLLLYELSSAANALPQGNEAEVNQEASMAVLAEVVIPRQSRPQWYFGVHWYPMCRCSTSPSQVRSCSSSADIFYNLHCLSTLSTTTLIVLIVQIGDFHYDVMISVRMLKALFCSLWLCQYILSFWGKKLNSGCCSQMTS